MVTRLEERLHGPPSVARLFRPPSCQPPLPEPASPCESAEAPPLGLSIPPKWMNLVGSCLDPPPGFLLPCIVNLPTDSNSAKLQRSHGTEPGGYPCCIHRCGKVAFCKPPLDASVYCNDLFMCVPVYTRFVSPLLDFNILKEGEATH